jgi:nucleotide-binding universal stress UspA family protein
MAPISVAIARILVPTDYSDNADHALDWALLQNGRFGAEVIVLHVIEAAQGDRFCRQPGR